jgi:hypothetical protein
MRIYLKFCASIYHFYQRKKDSMPDAMAFWLTTTILTANFFAVYDILTYYYFLNFPFSKTLVFSVFGILALLNYIVIFVNGSYKKEKPSSMFGIGVVLYIFCSIGIVIYTATIHRERNLQEKKRQQTEQRQ